MFRECVVAIYESLEKATDAVHALEREGFPHNQVSLVTHNLRGQVLQKHAMQVGDKSERNTVKGAGVGGLIGFLLGAPLLLIPGIGPLLVAGPMATGITGAIVGGFLGSMSGWGVHPDHIREYEKEVREGAILVVANGDPRQVADAKRILEETNPRDLHLHSEMSDDSIEVDDRPIQLR